MDAATQYALAYALTTSAGIRGLLTLAVYSVLVHAGLMHPPGGFQWLGATNVTLALSAVAVLDLLADKIPAVDHVLHAAEVVIKPACAAILVGGTLHVHSTPELAGLMGLGIVNALGIHAASATVRGTSTAFTAGLANPAVSTFEDVLSVALMTLAYLAPLLAAVAAGVVTIAVAIFVRKTWRRFGARAS